MPIKVSLAPSLAATQHISDLAAAASTSIDSLQTFQTANALALIHESRRMNNEALSMAAAIRRFLNVAESASMLTAEEANIRQQMVQAESVVFMSLWTQCISERIHQVRAPLLVRLERDHRAAIIVEAEQFLAFARDNEPLWRAQAAAAEVARRHATLERIANQLNVISTDVIDEKFLIYDEMVHERQKWREVELRSEAYIRQLDREEAALRRPPSLQQQSKLFHRPTPTTAAAAPQPSYASPPPPTSSYLYSQSRPSQPTGLGYPLPPQSGYGTHQPGYPVQPGYPPQPTQPGYPAQPGGYARPAGATTSAPPATQPGYHVYQHPSTQQYRLPSAFR